MKAQSFSGSENSTPYSQCYQCAAVAVPGLAGSFRAGALGCNFYCFNYCKFVANFDKSSMLGLISFVKLVGGCLL